MEPGKDIVQYADAAMYDAQPILRKEGARVTPRVFLLSATPDPLGNLAADMRMYRGDPVYDLRAITDEQRRWAWDELSKTVLNTPLEGVTMKFMLEAVTRSFTHQLVRQRVGAYYVQESLRFAVKRGLAKEVALPPSIITQDAADEGIVHPVPGTEASDIWHSTVARIEQAYDQLIAAGIPAEDARGILPHAVTTRVIYHTNLRALFNEAGKRLCTQAQFEWRNVFMGIMKALREYKGAYDHSLELEAGMGGYPDAWQWELIATPKPKTFAPVCYHTGTCQFMSMLDRGCSIRDRVLAFAEAGVPPEMWADENINWARPMGAIDPAEWAADPTAGITTETNRPE